MSIVMQVPVRTASRLSCKHKQGGVERRTKLVGSRRASHERAWPFPQLVWATLRAERHTGRGGDVCGESFSPLAAVHKALSEAALGQVVGRPSRTKLHRGAQMAQGHHTAKPRAAPRITRPLESRRRITHQRSPEIGASPRHLRDRRVSGRPSLGDRVSRSRLGSRLFGRPPSAAPLAAGP